MDFACQAHGRIYFGGCGPPPAIYCRSPNEWFMEATLYLVQWFLCRAIYTRAMKAKVTWTMELIFNLDQSVHLGNAIKPIFIDTFIHRSTSIYDVFIVMFIYYSITIHL